MKRIMIGVMGAFVICALAFMPAYANEKKMMDYGRMGKMESHRMMQDMVDMLKETMRIVRDLEHKPDAEDKKKLSGMIERLEMITKKHQEMMEERKEMMEKKKEMKDEVEKGN